MVPGTMKLSSWDIDSQVGACPRSWHGTSEATFGGFAGSVTGSQQFVTKTHNGVLIEGRSVMCAFFTQSQLHIFVDLAVLRYQTTESCENGHRN